MQQLRRPPAHRAVAGVVNLEEIVEQGLAVLAGLAVAREPGRVLPAGVGRNGALDRARDERRRSPEKEWGGVMTVRLDDYLRQAAALPANIDD